MPRVLYSISSMLILLCLFLFVTSPAYAQDATLTGTVADENGGPLPGVTVTVRNDSVAKTTYTDSAGNFTVAGLSPGSYDIAVELGGFVSIEQTATELAAGSNSLSFTMRPGGLAELMVVTASKIETPLINAPATISVIGSQKIESSPAQNYADLLRTVPGLNVTQTSARDINLTSRQANSTLATSQLALLDGRSIYLDFFGFIAWDFLPVNFNEIKQIEVIRGPASAVWGANAQTGVVNIITKTPRESAGATVTILGGAFDRKVTGVASPLPGAGEIESDEGRGTLFGANFRYAAAPNDKWSYKLSGGYFDQDPLARPIGFIPLDVIPNTTVITGGVPYQLASYENTSTSQPKFDVRVDQELGDDSRISYTGGFGGTDGIVHTGIGPFDIQSGTYLGYGKVGYSRENLKVNFFANFLDGDAINSFGVTGVDGRPVNLIFKNQTYDIDFSNSHLLGGNHLLSYGANYRRNNFDISIAAQGEDRNEVGGYIQDEFFVDKFRIVAGFRIDKFSVIDDPVFSPRVTAMYKPAPEHSIRGSFNKAFRSPSQINNFLDTTIINAVPLPTGLFFFPTRAMGSEVAADVFQNPDLTLKEESLTAYEVGYTGEFSGRTTVGISYYINDTDDNINFAGFRFYSATNPPPGWPLPPQFVPPNTLPSVFTYLNFGPIRQQGVELSFDHIVNSQISVFSNYSYQKEPEILEADPDQIPYPEREVIFPPTHRFNAGFNYDDRRFLGSVTVNYTSDAFWTDVLDARFFGRTDAFTQVNASFGVRWMDGHITTTLKITNLFNEEIHQHIFGDFLKRMFVGEVRFDF